MDRGGALDTGQWGGTGHWTLDSGGALDSVWDLYIQQFRGTRQCNDSVLDSVAALRAVA